LIKFAHKIVDFFSNIMKQEQNEWFV
jgi:hypothetical protein